MARKPGERFPSDHRRWFRVMEDILDDPKLENCSPDVFRFYFRLLAMLNRTKSRDGSISLGRRALNSAAGREQLRHSLRVARSGAEAGLYRLCVDGEQALITVSKWPELQYIAPTEPRRSPNDPPVTKTKTKTTTAPSVAVGADAPAAPDVDGFVSMLKGKIPTGLDGEIWATPAAWFEAHREQLTLDSQRDSGQNDGLEFQRHFRALMMRWWNHKQPKGGNGRARPDKLGVIAAEVEKSRQRDRERFDEQSTQQTGDGTGEGRETDGSGPALLDVPRHERR